MGAMRGEDGGMGQASNGLAWPVAQFDQNAQPAQHEDGVDDSVLHVQYSDGAWQEADEDHAPEPAGWGVAEFDIVRQSMVEAMGTAERAALANLHKLGQVQAGGRQGGRWGRLAAAESGTVCCDGPKEAAWIGARKQSNNTGELTALARMIARARARPRGRGTEQLWTDSLYALNMTTGRWLAGGCHGGDKT